jgi:hypothetical protein
LHASSCPSSSWIWKGLLKNREVIDNSACWSISDGANIHIWDSPWIPSMPSFKLMPNVHLVDLPDFSVADLLLPGDRSWNVDILGIHIPRTRTVDKWSWAPSSSSLFSVKSARDISLSFSRRISPLSHVDWQSLWGFKIQVRLKHLLWKIA